MEDQHASTASFVRTDTRWEAARIVACPCRQWLSPSTAFGFFTWLYMALSAVLNAPLAPVPPRSGAHNHAR
jgi:hypothetical protein